jgi:probable phosphoglycerate mutase
LPLLAEIAAQKGPVGAVTHKGIIRAVLALATGWDMTGKAPARLSWDALHLFRLNPGGQPRIERLNLSVVSA